VGPRGADANEVSVKGQAGQWLEEWAAVVRWSDMTADSEALAAHLHKLSWAVRGDRAAAFEKGRAEGIRSTLGAMRKAMRP
jgi:hypothetical protein